MLEGVDDGYCSWWLDFLMKISDSEKTNYYP